MDPAAKQYYQCANSPNSELSKFINFTCPLYKKSKLPGNFRSGGYRLDGSGIALCPECYNQKRQKYFDDINKIETAYGFHTRYMQGTSSVRIPVTRRNEPILTEKRMTDKISSTENYMSSNITETNTYAKRIPTDKSEMASETSERPAIIRRKEILDTSKKPIFAKRIMSEARPIPNFYERYNSDLGSSESDDFVLDPNSVDSDDINVAMMGLSIKTPRAPYKKHNTASSPLKNKQEEFVCRPKPRKNTKTMKPRAKK